MDGTHLIERRVFRRTNGLPGESSLPMFALASCRNCRTIHNKLILKLDIAELDSILDHRLLRLYI